MTISLKKLTPNIMVEDVNNTIEFYQKLLGFEVLVTVPEEGQFAWAMLKRDTVEMMFQSRTSLGEEIPALQHKEIGGSLTFYIEVEDVEGLYKHLKGSATIVQDMHKTFYGAQEFAIQDCNGFILAFAQTA
ncbi:MAG: VOC family protein [Ktedonobacteraceae bacterium]|nr:VOC family protein [Ktedonobacteraceae bacterium]